MRASGVYVTSLSLRIQHTFSLYGCSLSQSLEHHKQGLTASKLSETTFLHVIHWRVMRHKRRQYNYDNEGLSQKIEFDETEREVPGSERRIRGGGRRIA